MSDILTVLMTIVPLLISIVGTAILGLLIQRRRERNKIRLIWKSLPPESLLQIADDVRSEISIKF